MLEAGELDLQLALVGAGALREDVEDHVGAVVYQHFFAALGKRPLEVAHLRRRELPVEDHDLGRVQAQRIADLLHLARAREGLGVGAVAPPADDFHHLGPCAVD